VQETIKFDVQSRFSEDDLEYVTEEDSYQVLQSFDSWHEYAKDNLDYELNS
jgi:hypothetical protein